ncbi:hypothetical protein PQX77_020592 [Marasmius sp. AFHP31]|nr:hypothetical protein PQX77_020592 [Marasmius sp. AFHP31]
MPDVSLLYKGKHTNRSWSELPAEIVRMIATDYLWMLSQSAYPPEQWELRVFWYNRVVYTAIRDARTMDKLMNICPQWTVALETHHLWNHVVHALDPQEIFLRRNPTAMRQTPYALYRTIAYHACFICRVNSPQNSKGVGMAERFTSTYYFGNCGVCREHRSNNTAFCGLCLREGQPYELEAGVDPTLAAFCMINEDEDTWPGVDATCRSCRSEWLWRSVSQNPKHMEALGGRKFRVQDWEARTAVECFLELGESTIRDVINTASERFWLRKHTRLKDMMSQALAANRFANAENEDELEMELSSEVEEDEEEDMELLQLTEESGVKDLALGDWARHRILDGHWLNPADQWYGHRTFEVRAHHPCPWTIEADNDTPNEEGANEDGDHPTAAVLDADSPPTFALCELAFHAHRRQLRAVLMPAMKNVVRKLVIECGADGVDPALRASRMSLEEVMRELRDEAVWFDGVDWLERRRNARREEARRSRDAGSDDHASTTGSSSGKSSDESSSITSPVLSTSTFQTTPSPPPLLEGKDRTAQPEPRPVTIAVAPVLDTPRLIRPIPYVPSTAAHLPTYSIETFKLTWREACSPLYHCRCKICVRAQAKQAADAAGGAANQGNAAIQKNGGTPTPARDVKNAPLTQIQVREVIDVDAEGEPEVAFERSDDIELDDEDEFSDISDDDSEIYAGDDQYELKPNRVSRSRSRSPSLPPVHLTAPGLGQKEFPYRGRTPSPSLRGGEELDVPSPPHRPRKRSCDELEPTRGAIPAVNLDLSQYHRGEPGTPPKRVRRELPSSTGSLPPPFQVRASPSPGNMRKRGSQEIEDAETGSKRPKFSFEEQDREEDSGSGGSPPNTIGSLAEESDDVGDDNIIGIGPTSIGVDADRIPRSAAGDTSARLVTPSSAPAAKRAISPLPGHG